MEAYDPCKEKELIKQDFDLIRNKFNKIKNDCDDEIYKEISKYFNEEKNKIIDLIKALYEYYLPKKKENHDYILSLREFLNLFPRDFSLKSNNFRRQHVFEGLCKVMLLYNYDKNKFGKKKTFYESLEKYVEGNNKELKKEEILNEKINSGCSAQSVDIFFKISKKDLNNENYNLNACELIYDKEKTHYKSNDNNEKNKDKYILIQNKYYENEYASADKYDVNKIFNRARPLVSKDFENSKIEIILMVNNSKLLYEKIGKNRNKDFKNVNEIYGVEQLESWFQSMLYDLLISKDFESFINPENSNLRKNFLQLRLHQELFVKTTEKYIEEENKKFIWGAVPRSGKSYMIAGLINRRKSDNVLIVLGAKTETEIQFKDMFNETEDFNDYNIITNNKKETGKPKNIFILSQEKIKVNNKVKGKNKKDEDYDFDEKFKKDFKILFDNKNVDIYFDEIHKGGSTQTTKDTLILSLQNNKFNIEILVMVTATYAKPTISYSEIIDNKNPIVINWSYNDQQEMKQITNPVIKEKIIDRRENIEKEVFEKILIDYNLKYGVEYLSILEDEYRKHPELVIIEPYNLINSKFKFNYSMIKESLKLKCSAVPLNRRELNDPTYIFQNNDNVIDLIKFLGDKKGEGENSHLDPDSLLGYLNYNGFYDLNKRHSQLWFFPYKDLYEEPENCKKYIKERFGKEFNVDEGEDKNKTLPNIEPLLRGIVVNLLNNEYFKHKFCFLIVHGQKLNYYSKNVNEDIFKNECVDFTVNYRKTINNIIKDYEKESYKNNKSLIILTGQMLRLGISLPCVDIAINFDNENSIDTNYQTMFRVLTERKDKKYGLYIDLNKERAINFLYNFNEDYGNVFKKSSNITDLVSNLQSLLFLFNYNGLGIKKMNEKEELELYNTLINELNLTNEGYNRFYETNNAIKIEKLLNNYNIEDFENLKKFLFKNKENKKKVEIDLKEKEEKEKDKKELDEKDKGEDKKEQEENEKEENEEQDLFSIKNIADFMNTYTNMLAIFSDINNMNCDSLIECINKTIEKINKSIEENINVFDCSIEDYNVFGSYLNLIENFTPKKFIKSLEIFKKIIESEDKEILRNRLIIIFDNIKDIMKKEKLIYKMTPEEIQKKIEEYLPVREAEKDKFGEVFTPVSIIKEMLDKLPKRVWKNKDYKWLDPANGIGNFPMIVYQKLMEGLKDEIKDSEKRSEHIIKNMLYMCELNPKNVGVSRKIFGKDANIYCGDFLSMDIKKVSGIDKFDVIMGNPPFNKPVGEKRFGAGRTLWDKFIKKSLELLNINGYLGFINPANWRGLGELHDLWNIISKLQLLYLHIYGENDGKKYFKIGSRFDLYVLQKKLNTKPTEIIDEFGEKHLIKINEWPFLPNYNYKIFEEILTSPDKGIDVIYSSNYHTQHKDKGLLKEKQSDKYKYKVANNINEKISFLYTYDNTKKPFGIPKIILSVGRYPHPYNDYNGNYGITQGGFGIPIKSKKEGEEILKALDTPEFKKIIASTKWGAFQTDYRMFKYFKPDFYKYLLSKKKNKTRKVKSEPKNSKRKTISKKLKTN